MAAILIVDDEAPMRRVLSVILKDGGHEVIEAEGVGAARRALAARSPDLVITDQKMRDGDGLTLLAYCHEVDPSLPVIVLTAFATVDLAVEAMRRGAFDFLTKPFVPEAVQACVARACERSDLMRENARLRREVHRLGATDEIIGSGQQIQALRRQIARIGPTEATVLITGETGSGKELVARAIHRASARAERPFMAINCAALSESLLESELFGHERGAFTGADKTRPGLFEAAHGGTLFLDEAGEMPLAQQVKLLRVLVDGQVTRVGATTPRQVDVRVIAATHRDLQSRVEEGFFREDLYYRLAVVPIHVPPLRERPKDLVQLIDHFLQRVALDLNQPPRRISTAAIARLRAYAFPGNIRELRNLIERASILATGEMIEPHDLPVAPSVGDRADGADVADDQERRIARFVDGLPDVVEMRALLERVEQHLIDRALDQSGGVQAEAARKLGLSRSDMTYRLRKREEG